MRAVCWYRKQDVRVETVEDPRIINPRDAIVRVTSTSICGSDLHIYNGWVATMKKGDILGHEFMGEVMAIGPEVNNLQVGDRVVVPFPISCGQCYYCRNEMWSLCTTQQRLDGRDRLWLQPGQHLRVLSSGRGYAGGQAGTCACPSPT